MINDDDDQYFWCSFQAYQDNSIIIEYVVLGSQIVIFLMIIYAFLKAKKQNQFNQLSAVYKLIIAWLIFFFVKTLINVAAYFAYIQFSPENSQNTQNIKNNSNTNGLRVLSSLFLFLDVTTTFLLQTSMIYIPCLWMKNALDIILDQNFNVDQRKKILQISTFLGVIRKYFIIRNIYVCYFIAVSVTISLSDSFKTYDKYISLVSIIESLVILAVYSMGFQAFRTIKQKLNLKQKQQRSILIEYLILFVCNLVRMILNSMFYYANLIDYQPDEYCYDDHNPNETLINCLFLIFGLGLMHIIPGSMILYVYWPSQKDRDKSTDLKGSLLVSSQQTKITL